MEPNETDPCEICAWSFRCHVSPGPVGEAGAEAKHLRWGGLSEQLPDLSVNVAKEVHVGSAAVQTFILHQELTEQHLWFVPLPHDLELRGEKK